MKYLRSRYFIIHFMAAWWVLWLVISRTPLNIFQTPSWQVSAQFASFVLLFLVGHFIALLFSRAYRAGPPVAGPPQTAAPFALRRTVHAANWLCLGTLLLSLHLAGAFTDGFIEYFTRLRGEEWTGESLTGSRLLDVTTKAVAFPVSYTLTLVVLAIRIGPYRGMLAISAINILLFSYLWQVNYPLMHLFWFFVVYVLVGLTRGARLDGKAMLFLVLLFVLLLASAANRFGGDFLGGLQRYVFGYHLAGFSFYDHHFQNPTSLLHAHTFGRSSLGFLEQVLEIFSRRVDLGFVAASSENATYNNESIDLGATEIILGNAFGTFLFGFYRDFNVVGIAWGALLYGGLSTYLLLRSRQSWAMTAALYVLVSSWMVGMMVNPLEQVHFWFSMVFLWILSQINRGFRL